MKMLYITPVACPRPRFNRKTGGVYYPKQYTQYRKELCSLLDKIHYPIMDKEDADKAMSLYAIFAFNSYQNAPCIGKIDLDNLVKALCDTLQDYGAIIDDRQITFITTRKEFTKEKSHICFKLEPLDALYI